MERNEMDRPKARNQLGLDTDRETSWSEENLPETTPRGTQHANPCKVKDNARATGEEGGENTRGEDCHRARGGGG